MTVSLKDNRKLPGKVVRFSSTALAIALLAAIIIVAFIALRQQFTSTGLYRVDYEGKIVDKSVTINESRTGSRAARRLLIRGKSGEEFQVAINEVLYGRAQVGMWIKSSSAGAELAWGEP